ncbi:MAG TPA: NAD kinase [Saprospiraceae bacterium]|nr:NAD kinase [Saprospiraceae bacterium]HMP23871.1 NAD kinase [Saprospiraceae bacterium]
MQVVVYSREFKPGDTAHIQLLFDTLHAEGINAYVYRPYLEALQGHIRFQRDVGVFEGYLDFAVKKLDFFITLGGDGTILAALMHIRDSGVPIVGINLGRLGFLACIEKRRIPEAISLLKRGMYQLDERRLLYLESNFPIFGETRFALNDFTLLKRDTSSMITIHTYINGAYLNSYWSDGLIVSTPTGSTGYSLSCGGPIIFPNSGNFVITPVAPHNLSVRPIVISDNSVVSFEIEGRGENFLCTLDSRFETITAAHQLAVRKNDFNVRLAVLLDVDFLQTLREKLSWGADSRNH